MPHKNGNKREIVVLVGIALLAATIHLKAFSFRLTEDSPCWIAVSEYFLGNEGISRVSPHCLQNPLIPAAAAFISWSLGIPVAASYLLLNVIALIASAILIRSVGSYFTTKLVGVIATVLFLIDFQTQYYTFAVMPDQITWMMELLLIQMALMMRRFPTVITQKRMLITGAIAGLAVLTKTNLGFLAPLVPFVVIKNYAPRKFNMVLLYLFAFLVPTIMYWFWVFANTGSLPWYSLAAGILEQSPTATGHLLSFISAFLYTLPFLLFGIRKFPYRAKDRDVLLMILAGLAFPILVWPFVMPRFTFSLFVLIFPIAGQGVLEFAKLVSKNVRVRWGFVGGVLTLLFLMAVLRMYLTFTNQTHREFFYEVVRNLERTSV